MFSAATRAYFDHLPDLPGLDPAEARRLLSAAYADVLAVRDGFVREAGPPSPEVVAFLRRLAAALEAHGVFPDGIAGEERRAAAFIAAESLTLTQRAGEPDGGIEEGAESDVGGEDLVGEPETHYRLLDRAAFEAVEAALLYVIGGFETNGSLVLSDIETFDGAAPTAEASAAERALDALVAFVRLALGAPEAPIGEIVADAADEQSVASRSRAAAFNRVADAAAEHLHWLRGAEEEAWNAAVGALRESVAILGDARAARYADVQHLSRLTLRAIEETAARALRRVPRPAGDRYAGYIATRAASRPLIWPSGVEYAAECLPGPRRHAAVALPTGSGKSFIAELAVSQALLDGWVLYLVPTNALAVQVRRDLARALAALEGASVRAFVGGAEYTELSGESVGDVEPGTVMVMTPEKCALALRLSPEAFATLRLCVFDECHLISESGGRGVLAELVAAHVLATAPDARFLLLSAMIENPEAAAEWLEAATGVTAIAVRTPWRPTRTLRGVLGFERDGLRTAYERAQAELADLGANRRNLGFDAPYAALVNLQGAWTDLDDVEYSVLRLDASGSLTLRRTRDGSTWRYEVLDDGYLNPTIADVASLLSQRGERVLAFVPMNRHYAFSVAARVIGGDGVDLSATEDGMLIDSYLQLASFELGAPTGLADLIGRGVTVHSSALTDAERTASELAFQHGIARVMVATGTLAQGLNLPATAVLVGGTEIGYSPTPDADGEARVRAQLLNAIGRGGRPGVANHGFALVIPNRAVSFGAGELNAQTALQRAPVLAYEDASVAFTSRLGTLVALALEGAVVGEAMSTDEMVAYTYLPEADLQDALAQRILRRTYGIWRARPHAADEAADTVARELQTVGQRFVAGADAPAWTTEVAYRSGLALPEVFALYHSVVGRAAAELPTTIESWLRLLIGLLQGMPHPRARALLFGGASLTGLRFAALDDDVEPPPSAWEAFAETMLRYMRGESISAIAAHATGTDLPVDQTRTVGSRPVPKMLSFLQEMSYRLSMTAGALTALWLVGGERAQLGGEPDAWALAPAERASLDLLPLAIRSGSSTRSSLAWYRFGLRHRVAAHALAQSFPLPDEVQDDTAVRNWIRETRRAWLDGEVVAGQMPTEALAIALRRVANFEGV